MAISIQANSDNTTGAVKINGNNSFTFSQTGISLPGNATNALDAVPRQQLPYIVAMLTKVAQQTNGSDIIFDSAAVNVGGAWNSAAPTIVTGPTSKFGQVIVNIAIRNDGAQAISGTAFLMIGGVYKAKSRFTVEASGSKAYITLTAGAVLGGLCSVSISPGSSSTLVILGQDNTEYTTNFCMIAYP
jgi:hypothetical protein